ncbi:Receptor-like protein kinase HSL1 [Triticum urartu]|uniref:Receptor-like protein kinase HSL1 n=1 Tax=Triticum urartu TaxID=4572 RepID=M7YYS9_TRIUA|nr:Receptor-like protein kinase HSL1 [Triticum urartu]
MEESRKGRSEVHMCIGSRKLDIGGPILKSRPAAQGGKTRGAPRRVGWGKRGIGGGGRRHGHRGACNQLTGTIPPELGELTGLQTLKLEHNHFGPGKLPESFKNLAKLATVWLAGCNLTGEFPSYLPDLSELVWLDLSTNAFTGNIPPSIWNLTKLQMLYLHYNNLTGGVVIDGAIGAAGLIEIDLSYNKLTGAIPESLGTLTKLSKLCLSGNGFSGEIPASLAQLPSLVFLWLFENKLTGALPAELGMHSPSLRDIQVDDNDLSGPIPAGVCKNRGLWIITASGNRLNGSIPARLAHADKPAAPRQQAFRRGLTGTLPETLFWNMTRLYIMNNKFRGSLPSSAAKLQKFNAGNNSFSGEIPAGLAAGMPLLQEFILSSNQLSGAIPASIASLGGLTQMNFSNNQLTGEIPAGLGSMPVLTLLDLSSNQLSGSIPPALGSLRLNQLNLSSNDLAGEVPEALAVPAYDRSFLGNRALCTGAASSGNLSGAGPRPRRCSNILLDAELNAKVADFGLARILAEAAGTTPHDTVSAVAGTFGYMAPECGYTRKANEKVDVYSFGVVLLELATGREAGNGGEHCSLAEWAWRHLQSGKSIADAADECIGDARQSDNFDVVFKLGIICTGAQPSTRPTMKDVLQILLRCEQAHRKNLDEKTAVSEYDGAPLLPAVRGGSRRKRLSNAADGKGSFDDVV